MSFSSISERNASSICRPGMKSVRTSVLSTAAVFFSAPLSLSRVLEKNPMVADDTRFLSRRRVLGSNRGMRRLRRAILGAIFLGGLLGLMWEPAEKLNLPQPHAGDVVIQYWEKWVGPEA